MRALLNKYRSYTRRHLDARTYFREVKESRYNLRDWKNKIFLTLVQIIVLLGLPLMIVSAAKFFTDDFFLQGLVPLGIGGIWIVIIAVPNMPLILKKILIISSLYFLGLFLIFTTGPYGAGFVVISFSLVLSGSVLEKKHVQSIVIINWIIFIGLTIAMSFRCFEAYPIDAYYGSWLINVSTTQATSISLLWLMHIIYAGLDKQNARIKVSQTALQINDVKYKNMMSNISDVITILDKNGIITYKSPNVKNIFGWTSAELMGKNIKDYIHQDDFDRIRRILDEMSMNPLKNITEELRYLKASGDYVSIEMTSVNLIDHPSINGILVNYRDITLQKNNAKALLDAKEAAEAATRAKSQFLSVMSHEIRTPLNGIMGMLQLLTLTNLTDEQKKYLSISSSASTHLLAIINNVLDFSKLNAYKIELDITEIDIFDIVKEVKNLFLPEIEAKGLKGIFNIEDDVPALLLGDGHRIKQILFNLMSNAIKFTTEGAIELKVKGEIRKDDVFLKWSIKDTGIGLTPEQAKRIFEVFTQGESSTTRQYGGTGLGLSICKSLVGLMGGEIDVKSHKNKGSTFYFTTPLKSSVVYKTEKMDLEIPSTLRVLVAEDDEFSLFLLKKLGEKHQWSMVLVNNGEKAVEAFKKQAFDIVLMDVNMPVMDGIQASRLIKKINKDIPIIAVTAFSLEKETNRYKKDGFSDVISKPVDMKALRSIVSKWCKIES